MGLFSVPNVEDILAEVQALLENQQAEKAAQVLKKAQKKNIYHEQFYVLWAKAHGVLGQTGQQTQALQNYIQEKEGDIARHIEVIDLLLKDQQLELSQSFLDRAKKRFPMSGLPHSRQAQLDCKRGQYEAAAASLIQKQKYGKLDDQDIHAVHLIRKGVAGKPLAASKQLFISDQVHEILRRYSYECFESLGDDCSFGFIQRLYGREPLSLFRWGSMPRASMIHLFREQFKNFAQAKTTSLIKQTPDFNDTTYTWEFYFHDSAYDFTAHTNINEKERDFYEPEEILLERLRQHFDLLARKLHDDLELAEKIFVYKSTVAMSDAECLELHEAMCTMGNNKLLVVLKDADDAPRLRILKPNLLIGRINDWGGEDDPKSEQVRRWDDVIQNADYHFIAHFPELSAV